MVNQVGDDLLTAFDNFDNFFQTSDKLLPVANLFKIYDEMRFRERYWLVEERREMLDGWSKRETTLVYKIHFVFIIFGRERPYSISIDNNKSFQIGMICMVFVTTL